MKHNNLEYTIGNTKIKTNTMIFNFGSAHTCASAKAGKCPLGAKEFGGDGTCYSLKSEIQYPSVKPFRDRQEMYWLNTEAEEIASTLLEILKKHKKLRYIRLNESGDFHGIDCVIKLRTIARVLMSERPDITIYTYSHNDDLRHYFLTLPENVVINGSNFMVHNEFSIDTSIKKSEKPALAKKKMMCLDDCGPCNLCKVRHGKTITQAIH